MAAGTASRFAPLSYEKPKALIEVKGEILIERQIRQLREAGIDEIIVVVGYKQEEFLYLEEKFGVKIVTNNDYLHRNNNASIYAVKDYLHNSYVCSSDNYFSDNPFEKEIECAYYAAVFAENETNEWCLETDDTGYIKSVAIGGKNAWYMLGHTFWDEEFSKKFIAILEQIYDLPETTNLLWESIYMEHLDELKMKMRKYPPDFIYEFDTLDELRQFDNSYITNTRSSILRNIAKSFRCTEADIVDVESFKNKSNEASGFTFFINSQKYSYDYASSHIQLLKKKDDTVILREEDYHVITSVFNCEKKEIKNITGLKKGMTNHSVLFEIKNKRYILRIPGEGTDLLINRTEETMVYNTLSGRKICDNVVYISPETGYKITEYIPSARVCDPFDSADLVKCMNKLRSFHELKLTVEHEFEIFAQIEFYESLWGEKASVYSDYKETKNNVFSLKNYIDNHAGTKVLTHIDAVPDNFLIDESVPEEKVYLIDWEYAGMQDPHVDIAMFAIYAMYDKEHLDALIDMYFRGQCPKETKIKIYCYVACCGLLWSNWCEYKRTLGIEFGEYADKQYQYAKEYFKIVKSEIQ